MVKRRRVAASLVQALAILASSAAGQNAETNTATQFWPEFEFYQHLNKSARLLVFARGTSGEDVTSNSFVTGAYIDVFVPRFRQLLFRNISEVDAARARRITLRAGYRYITGESTENRFQTDATIRWAFKKRIWGSDRNRAEYRFINGDFSWRYRNEFKLEHDVRLGKVPVTPFVSAEIFYDSRYDAFSRWRYTGGAVFTLGRKWTVDSYFTRQVTKHSSLSLINAIGLKVSFYGF